MKLIAISIPNLSLSRFLFLPLALGLCNVGDCILHTRKPFCIYIYSNLLHLTGKLHSLTNLNLAAIWGWFLLLTIISSEGEQWGRYNLPKHLWHTRLWRFPEKWGSQKPRVSILYIYIVHFAWFGVPPFLETYVYIYIYIYICRYVRKYKSICSCSLDCFHGKCIQEIMLHSG